MKPKEIITHNLETIIDDLLCSDELRVFMFFYRHSDIDLSPLYLSQVEIGEKINFSDKKTRNLIRSLVERKLLVVTEKGGRTGNSGIRISLDYPNLNKLDSENLKEVKNMTTEKSLEYELTDEQKAILDIARHYEMLVRRETGKNGYNALSKTNPTAHKNWKNFVKLYVICDAYDWDAKVYVEYAFIHVQKYWKKSQFPYPNQLCAENIQKCFVIWLESENKKFKHASNKERTALKTESIREEIQRKLLVDVDLIRKEMKQYEGELAPEIAKAVVINDFYPQLSEFYLKSVEWFRGTLNETMDGEIIKLRMKIDKIGNDLTDYIKQCLDIIEGEYKVPRNITSDELAQLTGE